MLLLPLLVGLAAAAEGDADALLREELDAALATWTARGEAPHHVALALVEHTVVDLGATAGAVSRDDTRLERTLDVDLRMGTPTLDSTHTLRGLSLLDDDERGLLRVPFASVGGDTALRLAVRRELDARHRNARERLALLEGERAVLVEEEDPAPDFTPGAAVRIDAPAHVGALDRAWLGTLVEASRLLDRAPEVVESAATLRLEHRERVFVDTEGTVVHDGWGDVLLMVRASVVADDGDTLDVTRIVDVARPADLPAPDAVLRLAEEVVDEALALRAAPRAAPYTGPVLLSGRAAAVFLHEVLGHRAEADRNKRDDEGKTFLEQLGRPVLPSWVDVVDDPTLPTAHGVRLRGHYAVDDEGVPAARAVLVEDGVFRGFLMGRSPLSVQAGSNGHGRRSAGNAPAARMGTTILTAEGGLPPEALRRRLLAELRAQGLPHGYVVDEIQGGFTLTGRVVPNAFNVRASRTWRVHADGRPDELVRGIDLVGTPLAAFRALLAAGDTPEVFNGTCGAESGWVPVSAVAPPLLFRRLELQLKEKDVARPPLLAKPEDAGREQGT